MNDGNLIARPLTVGLSVGTAWDTHDNRKAVIVTGVRNGTVTISPRADVVDGQGLTVAQGDPPARFGRDDYG